MARRFLAVGTILAGLAVVEAQASEPVYRLSFPDDPGMDVRSWLVKEGFVLEQDFKKPDRIALESGPQGLIVDTMKKSFALMATDGLDLQDYSTIEIDWGVRQFPAAVSYEEGKRNESLMVFVWMGEDRMPSGSMLVPDSPYFFGLFLCGGDDRVNHGYVGSFFKESARYICLDKPEEGELVTSRFAIADAFHEFFAAGPKEIGISGLGLGLETRKAADGGRASAFIKEIRIYN